MPKKYAVTLVDPDNRYEFTGCYEEEWNKGHGLREQRQWSVQLTDTWFINTAGLSYVQ